jgi:hypothetical protein
MAYGQTGRNASFEGITRIVKIPRLRNIYASTLSIVMSARSADITMDKVELNR